MEQIVKVNLLIQAVLVRIVVLIVKGKNLIDINIMVTIGVGLIVWLGSGRIIGLTGEYGQLIIENGIVATILSVLAILIIDKEKKGMERVGLIVLATLGMIILVDAEDLLTVYLAMEAQSLAFYTLTGLLGVIARGAVIPFSTRAVLANINIVILYLFVVSSLRAYAVLVVLLFLFLYLNYLFLYLYGYKFLFIFVSLTFLSFNLLRCYCY